MASSNYSSTVTVTNDTSAPTLFRVAYDHAIGQWEKLPAEQIKAGKDNTFILGGTSDGSEGSVRYRREPGVTLTIYFKCNPRGRDSTDAVVVKNTVDAQPSEDFKVTVNETGSPLVAGIAVLSNTDEKPDSQ
ncbi:hypothetical protein PsYK624_160030 [Phanerochaete sordida]|uniref:Uncharacterized protein n=1 Tax=Phanerochaete sordida TaxID=48140 RepID=A0A9P3LMX1_9APHY|nr:hypothetical protein PsYK624_160030 [Phanerochaete sordida]